VRYDWRPAFGKFGLILGGGAFVVPMFLFRVPFPTLPALQKALLCCLLLASMGTCLLAGERRPLLGMVILPLCFLGIVSVACWWIVSG
jgi:hypothetical protein